MTEGSDPHVLYRFYAADGSLLYVGISRQLAVRWDTHARDSEWVPLAVRATLEHFGSKEAALAAELTAIRTEKPQWNKRDVPSLGQVGQTRRPAARDESLGLSPTDVAKLMGVSAMTVRRWEGRGLLDPTWRLPSGYRRYGQAEVEAFKRRWDVGDVDDAG